MSFSIYLVLFCFLPRAACVLAEGQDRGTKGPYSHTWLSVMSPSVCLSAVHSPVYLIKLSRISVFFWLSFGGVYR